MTRAKCVSCLTVLLSAAYRIWNPQMAGIVTRKTSTVRSRAPLSAVRLFKGLPASALRRLETMSEVLDVKGGDVFFRPGEFGQALFVLEKGSVQTFRTLGTKKLVIAELTPWEVFGEMACVGECLYHCTAQALQPSRVRRVSRNQVEVFLRKYPAFARSLLDLVGQRFFNVLVDLESTSFRSLIPRVASLLLKKAKGDNVGDLTHKEIAEHLRVYRESATEALGELRKAGIISIGRKQIRIIDRARLERASRE